MSRVRSSVICLCGEGREASEATEWERARGPEPMLVLRLGSLGLSSFGMSLLQTAMG
jgi:hypothetical protein